MSDARQILKALGSRPIAYHASLAKKLDSVTAALVVCQLMYWDGKGHNSDGWTIKTNAEFTDELGMSEHELETARRKCQVAGVVTYKRLGMPGRGHYRIEWDALQALLSQAESASQDSRKAPDKSDAKDPACQAGHKGDLSGGKRLTISETTSETTQREAAVASATPSAAPKLTDPIEHAMNRKAKAEAEGRHVQLLRTATNNGQERAAEIALAFCELTNIRPTTAQQAKAAIAAGLEIVAAGATVDDMRAAWRKSRDVRGGFTVADLRSLCKTSIAIAAERARATQPVKSTGKQWRFEKQADGSMRRVEVVNA